MGILGLMKGCDSMGLRLRIALLMCLAAGAAWSAVAAYESLKPAVASQVPEAVYAQYSAVEAAAQYQLKACDGYVAVYNGRGGGRPVMTDIELSSLGSGDRAMIELGLPVADREQLLLLLEDLGS